MKEAQIHRRAAERIASGRPWVYRSDILKAPEGGAGAVVRVVDSRNVRLGCAHYSSTSEIALRMLPFETPKTDQGFFRRLIKKARDYRDLVVSDTTAYRLVHAEADQLPGLVIDRYGDWFSIQTLTQGMDASKEAVVDALTELYKPRGIIERNDTAVRKHEGLEPVAGLLRGDQPKDLAIEMNGIRFEADLLGGQKTGMYLDQRENWRAAAQYARGIAMDCFSYNGGFALHMAGNCERVEAVDSSASALARVRRNASLNELSNVKTREAKVFDWLNECARSRREYDTIVLDPPAFAKSRKHVDSAARAYKEINLKALQLLKTGGFLITCSCSHHFSESDLLGVVAEAALDAGKRLRVVERRTQSRDHPISLTIPETLYLKCLILQAY